MKKRPLLKPALTKKKQSTRTIKLTESRAEWQKHLTAWLSSGISLKRYCIIHHLSDKQGYYWRNKLMPSLSPKQKKAAVKKKCIPVLVKKENEQAKPKTLTQTTSLYCIIDLGYGKQVRIVNADAYNQLLERLLNHAAIV